MSKIPNGELLEILYDFLEWAEEDFTKYLIENKYDADVKHQLVSMLEKFMSAYS